jgi:hypothetical protein
MWGLIKLSTFAEVARCFGMFLLDQADHVNDPEAARAPGLPKEHLTDKKNGSSRDKTTTAALLMGMGAGAGFLGVSRTTLWRMIRTGQLEKVEVVPGSYRVRRADLEAIAGARGRG